jgi:hypothetical protein
VVCDITELRYSLNGISDSQIQTLFNQIENEENQLIIKRVTDPNVALSSDDLLIEGKFSNQFLMTCARVFPPPLSCKIEFNIEIKDKLRDYAAFSWKHNTQILLGVTVFPYLDVQSYIGFTSSTHFLNLITSTRAASLLKSLLIVKPKGLVSFEKNVMTVVLPNHRIDFILAWINQLLNDKVDINWLSGSTGQLDEELVGSIEFVNQTNLEEINSYLEKAMVIQAGELQRVFRRALASMEFN